MINRDTGDVPHVSDQNHVSDGVVDMQSPKYPLEYEIVHMDSGKADVIHEADGPMDHPCHSYDYMGSPLSDKDNIAQTGMLVRVDGGARKRRER